MVENRGPQLQAVCSTFVSMAFVAVLLRIYVRLRLVKNFGWDDAWMVAAMLTHIMFATCAIGGIHYGTGRHMVDLSKEQIFKALRYWWLCYIAYCTTMISAKISIGLFLLRVTVNKFQRKLIYTVMGLTVLTGVVFFFVTLLQCSPISYFWNRWQPGTCVDTHVIIGLTYLYSVISAICDFTFGLLPFWLVWDLNMSRNAKIALVPIMSMACIASTAVIVRMPYVMKFLGQDFLYDTVDIAIWSDVEQGLAITAGSLATLRPLYKILSQRFGLSTIASNPLNGASSRANTPHKASGFSDGSKRKRSGPFSLFTITQHGGKDEDEYGLDNCRPVKLSDETGSEDHDVEKGSAGSASSEKGFANWRVQIRDEEQGHGSQEELSKSHKSDHGGIMRQTDVFQSSEYHPGDRYKS